MRELALFAGAGGGILGGLLLGWRTVCAVELDTYCRSVLLARQREGALRRFPIWDDVRTFDGHPWRGHIDVISGGFPCQDISCAGAGAGIDGARSGLWMEMARIIHEVRPRHVLVENSPMLTSRGLGRVLGDLATMGFDARWGVLGAVDVGAPHRRDRIWIVATDADSERDITVDAEVASASTPAVLRSSDGRRSVPNSEWHDAGTTRRRSGVEPWTGSADNVPDAEDATDAPDTSSLRHAGRPQEQSRGGRGPRGEGDWWDAEPDVGRVADGMADGMDRLRAIGNGQVPAVVRLAWETISGR